MRVIDLNGKERDVLTIYKMYQDIPDAVNGGTVKEPFIEVVIEGKQSTWVEWWPLSDFKENNPNRRPRLKK
jgi:hypothetical protein